MKEPNTKHIDAVARTSDSIADVLLNVVRIFNT